MASDLLHLPYLPCLQIPFKKFKVFQDLMHDAGNPECPMHNLVPVMVYLAIKATNTPLTSNFAFWSKLIEKTSYGFGMV